MICNGNIDADYVLGYFNTKLFQALLDICCPGLHYNNGIIAKLPLVYDKGRAEYISEKVKQCRIIAKEDWNENETSRDFSKSPFVPHIKGETLEEIYKRIVDKKAECRKVMAENETCINSAIDEIGNVSDLFEPSIDPNDVILKRSDLHSDICALISYAVGCMFGRYSLDVPGLVLAGQPFEEKFVHASNAVTGTGVLGAPGLLRAPGALYLRTEDGVKQCTFAPDVDNVIPITDEEYLEDDIIARLCDWLKVVYGADTLEANLDYIAKALGNKGSTSREVIRNYFVNDFFKDHCQTYSVTGSGKRPIYWLFDSGKQNGFKALIYLHRYTPDTIGTLRVDYLHKMQRVYESEINRMQDMMDHTTNAREAAVASKRKDKLTKQLKECRDYDEKISHLALSRIALDLDDGVKVNYRKLQTAADGKFYEVLADSKNIMAKEKK